MVTRATGLARSGGSRSAETSRARRRGPVNRAGTALKCAARSPERRPSAATTIVGLSLGRRPRLRRRSPVPSGSTPAIRAPSRSLDARPGRPCGKHGEQVRPVEMPVWPAVARHDRRAERQPRHHAGSAGGRRARPPRAGWRTPPRRRAAPAPPAPRPRSARPGSPRRPRPAPGPARRPAHERRAAPALSPPPGRRCRPRPRRSRALRGSSVRWRLAGPGGGEQTADRVALDRPRVPVRVLRRDVRRPVEVRLGQPELAQRARRADAAGERVAAPPRAAPPSASRTGASRSPAAAALYAAACGSTTAWVSECGSPNEPPRTWQSL